MFRSGKNINDTYEEEMLRKHGAIGGYSLIRLLEQDIHSINQESNEKKDEEEGESLVKRRRIERDEIVQSVRKSPQDTGNNPGIPDNPGNPGNVATPNLSEAPCFARPPSRGLH